MLLLAPRRVGKTSLLFALAQRLEQAGEITAVYASVAAARDELDFLRLIFEAVYATPAGRRLRPNFLARLMGRRDRRVKKLGAAGATIELEAIERPWQAKAEAAFGKLVALDRPWLLMIDELPTLVLALAEQDPTGTRARTFLHWFRSLRQQPSSRKLRFILAGSIGLDSVTRRHHITAAVNDLHDWRLGPYDEVTADRFLATLAQSSRLELSGELRKHILREAEWFIPYHLQAIFSELTKHVHGRPPERDDLDAVIERLLDRKLYFSSWEERLQDTFGVPHEEHARLLLSKCAATPKGTKLTTLDSALALRLPEPRARHHELKWIIDVLHHDGYVIPSAGRWRFRSGLLRRYWQRNCA